ncbi:keratinocyte-associated protein 2-like isoform X2 [Gigantopelta aegis]|uniref:keratinocyte-associated protein 2-like isoform X2 n=1 Tax=Gigantopelta aegis TaxID=1735272 RepID=UPI001B88A56F|nr:keratinocyte-associated protein 2-like isoform X2 [Gigantopelta aegis]
MALSSGPSFVVSATLTISIFAGMQMFKHQLASTEYLTVLGGFIGSLFFIMLLTAVGNIETIIFGKGFHTKLVPEVIGCLLISMFSAGLIHRVCVTTCLIFSLVALYYVNKISQSVYAFAVPTTATPAKKKR